VKTTREQRNNALVSHYELRPLNRRDGYFILDLAADCNELEDKWDESLERVREQNLQLGVVTNERDAAVVRAEQAERDVEEIRQVNAHNEEVVAEYLKREGEAIARAELLDRALAELDEPLRLLFKANGGVGLDSNPERINAAIRLIYDLQERAEKAERERDMLDAKVKELEGGADYDRATVAFLRGECDASI